jgi:hypothetical protein
MQSTILVIENLTSDNNQYGWLLSEVEKILQKHTEITFLSRNVLMIPSHFVLLAISEIDAQCRISSAMPGQSFSYKCLFLEEDQKWICSTGILQKQEQI